MQPQIAQTVKQLLGNRSTTFAHIDYTTEVKTAAAHKAVKIVKNTAANVQLFSNINAATSVFANAVKKSAANVASNDAANVEAFTAQSNYYEHTDCYSIVQHKDNGRMYLYCIYNNAESDYYIDGVKSTKEEVAAFLTPSAAKQLLNPAPTHNKTYDVTHNVVVRVIALENINMIRAAKQEVSFN